MRVFRIGLAIENGISSVRNVDSHTTQLGEGYIRDLKFADDKMLLILWESKGKFIQLIGGSNSHKTIGMPYLLSTPYRGDSSSGSSGYLIKYYPHKPKSSPLDIKIVDDEHVMDLYLKHRIPTEASFIPATMEIRGSNGRKDDAETRRILIMSRDRLHYKVFKMSSPDVRVKSPGEDIPVS